MVKAHPGEILRDVIAVTRRGQRSVRQVAKNFGVPECCLARWPVARWPAGPLARWLRLADRGPRTADRDDGISVAASRSAKAVDLPELWDARKRIRLLEQVNEILRKAAAYFAQSQPPK